jgi:hypothetical protein
VGGVSGEPMGVHEEERSSHVLRSQRWKASGFASQSIASSAFAGGRSRASLGRSVCLQRARSWVGMCTDDKGCPLDKGAIPKAGGERRQRAPSARTLLEGRRTSTFGFRGHVLHSIQRLVHVSHGARPCRGLAIAIGQTTQPSATKVASGWSEPVPGVRVLDEEMRGSPRFAVSQENVRGS